MIQLLENVLEKAGKLDPNCVATQHDIMQLEFTESEMLKAHIIGVHRIRDAESSHNPNEQLACGFSLKQAVGEDPDDAIYQIGLHCLCTLQLKTSQGSSCPS